MNKSKKSYVHDLRLLFFYNQNHVLSHLLFNLPFCEPKKTHQLFFNVVSLISTKGCFHLPLKNSSHLQIPLLLLFFLIKGYQGSFLIFLMNKENRVLCFSTVLTAVFFMILILHAGELHVHKSFVIHCYFHLHISALFAMSEIFFNTALVYSLLYRSFSGEILC